MNIIEFIACFSLNKKGCDCIPIAFKSEFIRPLSLLYKNVHNIATTTIEVTTGLKKQIRAILDVFNFVLTNNANPNATIV